MPRPGCVWSHVLLIELTDLAEIGDLGGLRDLFLRPANPPMLEEFTRPLLFNSRPEKSLLLPDEDDKLAAAILWGLYSQDKETLVVSSVQSTQFEELLIAIWSQQWPRLRRNFLFSTGSFADRGRGGRFYDIQIAPKSSLRAWSRNEVILLDEYGLKDPNLLANLQDPWIQAALDDLRRPDAKGFRSFLRKFGADVGEPRIAYGKLSKLQFCISGGDGTAWGEILQQIASYFPSPDEAGFLKQACLSNKIVYSDIQQQRELECITFLCLQDVNQAFVRVSFNFVEAVAGLWPDKREAIIEILSKPPLTEGRWTELLSAVTGQILAAEFPWLWNNRPELLAPLIKNKPKLAAAHYVWQLPERAQWNALEALESVTIDNQTWSGIVRSMLEAGTTVAVREVVELAGHSAFEGFADWLKLTSPAVFPLPVWRDALRPVAEKRLREGGLSPLDLALCMAVAPSAVIKRMNGLSSELLTLASVPLDVLPAAIRLSTAFLLVTIGLQSEEEVGERLLSSSFFHAHSALEGEEEPPEAWRILQPYLPKLWPWQEWDRCKKMRRAFKIWIENHPRSLAFLIERAKTREERQWLEKRR